MHAQNKVAIAAIAESAMKRRCIFVLTAIAALGLALLPGSALSQQKSLDEDWQHDFTVLTMAPDGSWGAATEPHINRAIAGAIASCKAMSRAQLGCGAYFTSIRAGWSLGIRCGREIIIVAEKILADAESRAIRRETKLREVRDMPACARVVMVDPNGVIAVARAGHSSTWLWPAR
jgi:hypothetical protein